MPKQLNVEQIARVCHDANAAYCRTIGDDSQPAWDEAEDWRKKATITGVEFTLANPDAPASAQHEDWLKDKEANGWTYGPKKDPFKKQHPCMVPYPDLSLEQRLKDHLFRAVVQAFVDAGNG